MPWNEPGSGNKDPWGNGNRGRSNQGPDLENVINNVRDRFGGGRRSSRGGVGGFPPLILIVLLAIGFWLFKSVYQVDEGHEGVELRFGKYTQTVGPGLNFIFWPIERNIVINTQEIRAVEVGYRGNSEQVDEALMLTKDENIVGVTMAVQYTIKSIEDLIFNVGDLSRQGGLDRVVRSATESALREVVGRTEMDALLTTDRPVVDSETEILLQAILDRYSSGINIQSVETQDAKPPLQVREAFDDVVKADQDKVKLVNEAETYAKQVVPNARGEAEKILQEAEAYKSKIVAEATGEAQRFDQILGEYQKAPEITKKRLYIESIESVLSNTNKVMIDQQSSNGNSLMYLPIDKLIESGKRRTPSVASSDNVLSNMESQATESTPANRRGGR